MPWEGGAVLTRESLIESLRVQGFKPEDYRVEEVESDFSHLHPWDRPPPFVARGIRISGSLHRDRSLERKPFPRLPGWGNIAHLKDSQSGRCVVLGNGPSVASFDLNRLAVPIIGCNRTFRGFPGYEGPDTDWLCVIDVCWLNRKEVATHPGLMNFSTDGRKLGIRVARSHRMFPWSFDLARDGAVDVDTGACAMQLAVYLGFTEVYLIGFDGLGRGHFDGTESGQGIARQDEWFGDVARALEGVAQLYTVGFEHPAFPRAEFDPLTEGNVKRLFIRNNGDVKRVKFETVRLPLDPGEHEVSSLWPRETWLSVPAVAAGRSITKRQAAAEHIAHHCAQDVSLEWR